MSGAQDASIAGSLAVAETPLHLFNLVNLLSSGSLNFATGPVDLMVYDQFSVDGSQLDRIAATGLFRDVYTIAQYEMNLLGGKAAYYTAWRIARPHRHRSFLQKTFAHMPRRNYAYLIAGVGSVFLMDVRLSFCPQAITVFYEEGEGSYFGNFVKAAASYDKEILATSKSRVQAFYSGALHMLLREQSLFNAQELYLYRPDLVSEGLYQPTLRISRIACASRMNECLECAFGRTAAPLAPVYTCLLGNAVCDRSDDERARSHEINATIARELHEVVFRPHPRSPASEVSLFHAVDHSHVLWESRCLRGEVNDDSVLIGYGSTAQTNPKKLFDLEPTNVFLHRLMPGGMDRTYAERSYHMMYKLYRNKNKLHCPATLDELSTVLARLKNGKSAK